ncbi:MAG: peptidoglycan DD-metalloendopeptidase family protein, partial [Gemmatimonadales bacterium]
VLLSAVGVGAVGVAAALGLPSGARVPQSPATPAEVEFADTLRRNETLSDLLLRQGLTPLEVTQVAVASPSVNARRLRAGLVFRFRHAATSYVPSTIEVRVADDRRVHFVRGDSGWSALEEAIPFTVRSARVHGVVETSLYEALDAAIPDTILPRPERFRMAWALADVYDWEVDFTRDLRAGAKFDVLMERLVSDEGEVRFGRVVAARLDVPGGASFAYWFEPTGAPAGYYDADGRSLRRAFLRTPLEYRRVSSRFASGRFHPILGRWRSHTGTDYAADYGTPVRATADGTVEAAGRDGGYGNMVVLRHAKGISTRYAHLSRFAAGVRQGARVRQGETIGYVGSTGLSTGPHLHYEFRVQGRPTNPQRRDMGAGAPIPAADREAFMAWRDRLKPYLAAVPTPTPTPVPAPARVD